jgi:glycosyltransferase involved in cell wall biosynthesis
MIKEFLLRDSFFVIGLSNGSLIMITQIISVISRDALNRSIVMVMGGTLHKIIEQRPKLINHFSNYKRLYVETESMKISLSKNGLKNVEVFPNCRDKIDINTNRISNEHDKIKCLYFSLISTDKGADIVVETAKHLESEGVQYEIDFYGPIDENYSDEFHKSIKSNLNINYRGVFKSSKHNKVYSKLAEYDVLLFPTRWKNEGVPGVLVESKIAGIPSIVSDINFNAEIINDGSDGIVMNENSALHIFNAINLLYSNRKLLSKMKYNAKGDSINYLIDNYINNIINDIRGERN